MIIWENKPLKDAVNDSNQIELFLSNSADLSSRPLAVRYVCALNIWCFYTDLTL